MKTITQIAGMLLLLSGVGFGQAFHRIERVELPMSGIVKDCEGSNREPLAISGTVEAQIKSYNNPSLKWGVDVHWTTKDAKVIGMETGNEYKLIGQTFTRYSYEPDRRVQQVTERSIFKIPGMYSLHFVSHHNFYFDEFGFFKEVRVLVDKLDEKCGNE